MDVPGERVLLLCDGIRCESRGDKNILVDAEQRVVVAACAEILHVGHGIQNGIKDGLSAVMGALKDELNEVAVVGFVQIGREGAEVLETHVTSRDSRHGGSE